MTNRHSNFILLDMLKAIPDPERTIIEANIKAQLQEALVSTIAAIDPSLDDSYCAIQLIDKLQADYIPLDTGMQSGITLMLMMMQILDYFKLYIFTQCAVLV